MMRHFSSTLAAGAAAACLSATASAEILQIRGSAAVSLQEFRFGAPVSVDQASDRFPETSDVLPLQVLAQLVSDEPEPAAAAAAAQFADPTELAQPNPEEFAVNMALGSVSPNVRYSGNATLTETRDISLSAEELGQAEGSTVAVGGRLFLDGALAIYAANTGADLSNSRVTLRVTVEKIGGSVGAGTVFSGTVELVGDSSGGVTVGSEGDFPTGTLIFSNVGGLIQEFAAFSLLIIPRIEIDYEYDTVVGEQFQLLATVTVDASNTGGDTGVAALLGTPTDALAAVIEATDGQAAATSFLSTIQKERDDPSGEPAFPEPPQGLFGLCGLFGVELGVLGLALAGMKARRR